METRAFQMRRSRGSSRTSWTSHAKSRPEFRAGSPERRPRLLSGGWDYGRLAKSMTVRRALRIGLALPICRDLFPTGP